MKKLLNKEKKGNYGETLSLHCPLKEKLSSRAWAENQPRILQLPRKQYIKNISENSHFL